VGHETASGHRQPVELGVMLPLGWRGELAGLGNPSAQWARVLELARLAEDLGLDSVWVSDHLMTVPGVRLGESVFECWTTLAALATTTRRVRLGQLAGCAVLRPPGLVAKSAAVVDVMSGGRLEWGIGAGWYEGEARAYGYSFPAAGERIERLAEYVEVVRSLWTRSPTSFAGRYFRLDAASCDPKPLQRPHPRILVAGAGPRHTLRVVARHADRANWGGDAERFAVTARILHEHCRDVGRDPAEIELTWGGELFLRDTPRELRTSWRGAALQGDSFDSWVGRSLAGDPTQVVARMTALVEAGVHAFIPWCHDFPSDDTLRRYATEVAPRFR
jgi:F420-dependent oxidoreductase-like protein